MATTTANKKFRMYPLEMRGGSLWGLLLFMNALQVFSYKGSNVTFSNENGMWVNATEMAKPFGKEAKHWLVNQTTKEFVEELANVRNLTFDDLVQVKQGSPDNGGGTWFHEDVAIEFARWLSPLFAIWCNDRIKEILTGTMAKYPMSSDEAIAYGYGKALEKMNRQSAIIARQSKLLRKYKSQIAVDKEKKRERTMFMSDRSKDNVSRWISENGISGLLKLSALHKGYHEWCEKKCVEYMPPRMLCRCLRSLEYVSKHKRDGTWFMI